MSNLWLPFTQMRGASPRNFVRGAGNYLIDADGRSVFDATSSIWTILHGHGRPELIEAITLQAERLDHSTLLGATHARAEELAERLCTRLGLARAFFSGDGASAVEAALKMAVQYWRRHGKPERNRFVRLSHGYHGDTVGAMSVSDIAVFKGAYGDLMFASIPYAATGEQLLREDLAAVIVEPRVQAAAGLRAVPDDVYALLGRLSGDGPLVIVDEIATGFGRTGTWFAFEGLGLQPDIVCVGKGLTGGVLALSATVVTQNVFDSFLGEYQEMRQFFHGHSFAGSPIACAAALASLAILETEDWETRVLRLGAALDDELRPLHGHELVRDVRRCGLMCGVELAAEKIASHHPMSVGWDVADRLYERGQFTRPIGDTIQLVPPLSSSEREIRDFARALCETVSELSCI